MTDKELIKKEIERRMNISIEQGYTYSAAQLKRVIDFIDSLPKEHASEDLEEAKRYAWFNYEYRDSNGRLYQSCFEDGFELGAQWQKQQMMKDAVEAEVFVDYNINYGYGSLTANIDLDEQHLKEGDKVKIIIVKTKQQ